MWEVWGGWEDRESRMNNCSRDFPAPLIPKYLLFELFPLKSWYFFQPKKAKANISQYFQV
ncbi:hypothetical protein D5R40_20980 [Okeania hirsuta]|uniref:Uncharacterized protein n=1 Tax=Okeania hirsuta TaxID=1458930 RepID=A0A3N6RJH1_9CYAN|nr:hypothetical protein D4Z78_15190 [Okeania hirsuta]RQH34440.1 hypothetical protein D5R40_20980 [Okeania hirsuta]